MWRVIFLSVVLSINGCVPSGSVVKDSVSSALGRASSQKNSCSGDFSTWSECTGTRRFGDYVYTGQFLNGLPHGKGEEAWSGGAKYVGSYLLGKRHGSFNVTFPDGDKFTGEYIANKRNGPGRYEYADGTVFTGGYKDGEKHGLGTFRYKSGRVSVSDYIDGQRSGQVTSSDEDGSKRWGYAFDDKLAPFRVIKRTSGLIGLVVVNEKGRFDGPAIWFNPQTEFATLANYSSGKLAGKIIRFDATGHISDISIMANDEVIEGTSYLPFGNPNNDKTYDYQCLDQRYSQGRCAIKQPYTAGGYYEGSHNRDSEPDGYGIRVYENGEIYRGEYADGNQHGYYSYFWPDGEKAFGYQEEGDSQGLEIYVRSSGSILFSVVTDGEADGLAVEIDPTDDSLSWFSAKGESYERPIASVLNEKIRTWEDYASSSIAYKFDDGYRKIAENVAYTADADGVYWPSEEEALKSGSEITEETVSFWTNESRTVEGRVMVYESPEEARSAMYNGLIGACREDGGLPTVALVQDNSQEGLSKFSQSILCTDYGEKGIHITSATHSLKASGASGGVLILEIIQHSGDTNEMITKFKRASGEI